MPGDGYPLNAIQPGIAHQGFSWDPVQSYKDIMRSQEAIYFWASPPPWPLSSAGCVWSSCGADHKEGSRSWENYRWTHLGSRDKAPGPSSATCQLSHLKSVFPPTWGWPLTLLTSQVISEAHACVRAHVCANVAYSTIVKYHLFTDMPFLPIDPSLTPTSACELRVA